MVQINYSEAELPKCRKCGAPVPSGKTLCWLCEHEPKLHKPEEKHTCDSDSCTVDLAAKESQEVT